MSNLVNYAFWKWDGILPKEFCRAALEQVDWVTSDPARIDKSELPADPSIRVTDIIFQDPILPLGCIARTYIEVANQNAGWNYVLTGQQDTQIARYKSIDNGHYDWHMDAFPPENGTQRKLTCVILLNDPSEFEGGELQFKTNEGENMLTKQGSIIVFPSFIEHKVTPITKGVRYTSVTWATGPAFK